MAGLIDRHKDFAGGLYTVILGHGVGKRTNPSPEPELLTINVPRSINTYDALCYLQNVRNQVNDFEIYDLFLEILQDFKSNMYVSLSPQAQLSLF